MNVYTSQDEQKQFYKALVAKSLTANINSAINILLIS